MYLELLNWWESSLSDYLIILYCNMETKKCTICKRNLSLDHFSFKDSTHTTLRWCCKECNAKKYRDKYRTLSESELIKERERHRNWRNKNRERDNNYRLRWRNENKERFKESCRKTKDKNKKLWKIKLWWECYYLIKKKWLRTNICSLCNKICKTFAHHPDYNKPYEVIFVCNHCHSDIHNWYKEVDKSKIVDLSM